MGIITIVFCSWILSATTTHSNLIYISPSSGRGCPINQHCLILSQVIPENDSVISGNQSNYNNITLLFLPGNHTLIFNLTFEHLSYLSMKSNTSSFPKPVINCIQFSNFQFTFIDSVTIENLKFNGCLHNRVSAVHEFTIQDCTLIGSNEPPGRALTVANSNMYAVGNSFRLFSSFRYGIDGILHLSSSRVYMTDCVFMNNQVRALYATKNVNMTIANSNFTHHTAACTEYCTGGIMYFEFLDALIINCTFANNRFDYTSKEVHQMEGGVIAFRGRSNGIILNSRFLDNVASIGTAVYGAKGTHVTIFGSVFHLNRVTATKPAGKITTRIRGGTIYCDRCWIVISSCTFEHNRANHYGGAVLVFYGYAEIHSCQFSNNTAEIGGGFYAAYRTNAYLYGNNIFENNVALYGAAVHAFLSTLTANCNLTVINNIAKTGAIGIIHSMVSLGNELHFSGNIGSIFTYSGEISISGMAILSKNDQFRNIVYKQMNYSNKGFYFSPEGGGITLFVSRLILHGIIMLVSNNTASNGGGILATTSSIVCNNNCSLSTSSNTTINTGGGIYLYQSELSIYGNVTFNDNLAMKHGGALHAISAFIKLMLTTGRTVKRPQITFTSNLAIAYGGGIYFETGSKIYILRYYSNSVVFVNNTADYGGAIYIADDTNIGACLDFSNQSQPISVATQSECFFQLSSVVNTKRLPLIESAFHFDKNVGKYSGDDLFGGLLDRCTITYFDRIIKYSSMLGFADYILNSTSSKPVRLCLCDSIGRIDCDLKPTLISAKKDEKFILKIAAVDHVNHTMNATIYGSVTDNQARLGAEQRIQSVESGCNDLVYSVVSPKEMTELEIYTKSPCKNLGISALTIPIKFIPCSCPLGFEHHKVTKNKCHCICHHKLKQALNFATDAYCNPITLLVTRNRDFWVSYTIDRTLLTYKHCPSDYCHPALPSIHINLSNPHGPDVQCKLNRSGILCGSCKVGHSLSLGSPQCVKCRHYWPVLFCVILVGAFIAGAAMVVLLLLSNLTVAKGTLNAMIFYANVLSGNQALFLTFENLNFHRLFIAWLNLDVGFDVCFFKGLDMYFKVWLQLLFPVYLIFLVIAVILASKYSMKFAKLVGKRNPIATLATLILLSYARLLHSTISIFSFATLHCTPIEKNDSYEKAVWLSDASLPYLSGKHIPLFIVAILILLIGVPYTIILISWQWLSRLPNWTAFGWVRNSKLASFMDAYHAPFVPRNRYWTGLLLFGRVMLYLTAAINVSGEPRVNLLAVLMVIGSIFLLHAYSGLRIIYKQWILDIFEFTTYFNILAFTVAKFYALQSEGSDITIASMSISVQFVIFICTLVYHTERECNIFRRMKILKLNKIGFCREITTSLLDNEATSQASIQLVTCTHSEVEIKTDDKCVLTSKGHQGREDILALLSE